MKGAAKEPVTAFGGVLVSAELSGGGRHTQQRPEDLEAVESEAGGHGDARGCGFGSFDVLYGRI